MKRNTCSACQFPLNTCVCSYIGPTIENAIDIIVMQHPSEVKIAKNTAKLLSLQLSNVTIYIGENESDFNALRTRCADQRVALLYPNDQAHTLISNSNGTVKLDAIIVLDGTWKKATKLYQLNQWLHALPSFKFDTCHASEYTIRKSKHKYSLSTLEAAAQFLDIADSCDTSALYQLQAGMVKEQMKLMPADVKARY